MRCVPISSMRSHCGAAANVGGDCQDHRKRVQCIIADVLQVQSWVQVVGTSSSVRHRRRENRQEMEMVLKSCRSFATTSACSCGWTANPVASTDASAQGAICFIHRCPSRAPSAIAVVEAQSFQARARVRDAARSI